MDGVIKITSDLRRNPRLQIVVDLLLFHSFFASLPFLSYSVPLPYILSLIMFSYFLQGRSLTSIPLLLCKPG